MTGEKAQNNSIVGVGYAAAVSSSVIWGLTPIYYVFLRETSLSALLLNRLLWAVPFIFVLAKCSNIPLNFTHRSVDILLLAIASLFLTTNWGIAIYSVLSENIIQMSLGYFIYPIIGVGFGAVFFNENMTRSQIIAVGFVGVGIFSYIWASGSVPVLALVIAAAAASYGALKRVIKINATVGLLFELSFALPIVILILSVFADLNLRTLMPATPLVLLLWVGLGPLTAIPAILFTIGAQRIPFSALSLLQFLAPTLQFTIAVILGEGLETYKLFAFTFVWIGVLVFICNQTAPKMNRDN